MTGTAGDPDARDTLVFVAHHDAANGGLIFRPELTRLIADTFPRWYERQQTSPQVMRLVAAGPALAALGALTGVRPLRQIGLTLAAGSALAFFDIGTRTVVPGANDNLTAVAVVLELARLLREEPVSGVRVLLVSTGSEESFMEGMRGWVRRHGPSLDPDRTRVVVLETLGSPELILLEGEGMIWMSDYDTEVRDFVAAAAERAGEPLRRGLKLGFATDALSALRGGLRAATLASCDEYKMPANYHSQRDIPRNVDYETVAAAARGGRDGDQVSSERARLIASSRVWISPAYCASSSSASRRPTSGPWVIPSSRARSCPRTSGSGFGVPRRSSAGPSMSRASSRWAAIAGSAFLPRVASRSATVKTVTSAA